MSKFYCTGTRVLNVKNSKTMELVSLVKEEDFGKMASNMPIVAINNSKVKLEYGVLYDCKVYLHKGNFSNLYKVTPLNQN